MAAIEAARRGRTVALIDQGKRVGGKIPVSGGGRCNFTNRRAEAGRYVGANPDFARSALSLFGPHDVEAWIAAAGIPYHEKKDGQLFCDRSALDVVALLEKDLRQAGVRVGLARRLERLERREGSFVASGADWSVEAPKVVVALGGPSYPALGANDLGARLARAFGLETEAFVPALTGFKFAPQESGRFGGLEGLTCEAELTVEGRRFRESLLFTHLGLGGPAAFQASLVYREGGEINVDFWPGEDPSGAWLEAKRTRGSDGFARALSVRLPRRLAERWAASDPVGSGPLERVTDRGLREAALRLKKWSFRPAGVLGWDRAEVARGGILAKGLNQRSLEARSVPGLHFVGESVDITGELGGFNLQWAFSSGVAAGRSV
jgi:hypothetical protein